jgi:hypothetical protein
VGTWAYWECKFKTPFPEVLKNQLVLRNHAFLDAVAEYESPWADAQAVESALRATRKSDQYPSREIARWVEMNCMGLQCASISEKASHLLREFKKDKSAFLVECPEPKGLYTKAFYLLFGEHGINCPLGSARDLHDAKKDIDRRRVERARAGKEFNERAVFRDCINEPPFVELVRRWLWKEKASIEFYERVQKIAVRGRSKLRPAKPG